MPDDPLADNHLSNAGHQYPRNNLEGDGFGGKARSAPISEDNPLGAPIVIDADGCSDISEKGLHFPPTTMSACLRQSPARARPSTLRDTNAPTDEPHLLVAHKSCHMSKIFTSNKGHVARQHKTQTMTMAYGFGPRLASIPGPIRQASASRCR